MTKAELERAREWFGKNFSLRACGLLGCLGEWRLTENFVVTVQVTNTFPIELLSHVEKASDFSHWMNPRTS